MPNARRALEDPTLPSRGDALPPTPGFVRPVLGLLGGLGITVAISGLGIIVATLAALRNMDPRSFAPTPGYLAATLAMTALGAMAGGYATGRITTGRSFYTVLLLSLVLLVSGVVPALRGTAPPHGQPAWYPLTLALLAPLGAIVGGLFERRPRRASP